MPVDVKLGDCCPTSQSSGRTQPSLKDKGTRRPTSKNRHQGGQVGTSGIIAAIAIIAVLVAVIVIWKTTTASSANPSENKAALRAAAQVGAGMNVTPPSGSLEQPKTGLGLPGSKGRH